MNTVTICRGLPGSGKSTIAKSLNAEHVEADMFFMKNGKYIYDNKKINDAHKWCQSIVKFNLRQGKDITVSNTFTTLHEIDTYLKIAKFHNAKVQIIECYGNYKNVHNIPQSKINLMKDRWEKLPINLQKLCIYHKQ